MGKVAFWPGRFQPTTLGHVDGAQQIKEGGIEKIYFGIGSAQEEFTQKNPFTFYERKEILKRTMDGIVDFEIFAIPDFNDDGKWTEYILRNVPEFDTLYSGNVYVHTAFSDKSKEMRHLTIRNPIKASNVRQKMADGTDWDVYMNPNAADYVREINGPERLEKLLGKQTPLNPYLAADAVIEYENGYVIIERKNKPFGYALVGGFVDYGESAESAIVREVKEEVNLDFKIDGLIGFYSEPARDRRRHIASAAYYGKGTGELKAGDDAKAAVVMSKEEVLNHKLIADHNQIFIDYLKIV